MILEDLASYNVVLYRRCAVSVQTNSVVSANCKDEDVKKVKVEHLI